jgi:transposase
LEGQFELLLANATHVKNVPGRKTDVKDSEWIAQLMQHGLLKPSFVPDTVLRDLRELSRDRTSLVAERSRLKNRIQKILEDANIKLGSVASDILGKSGRAMLTAMVKGTENPEELADLAQGQLRLKIPQLVEALRGRVRAVHRFRLQQQLERIDFVDAQIAQLEEEIEKQNAPFEEAVSLLAEIPGFDRTTAGAVIAEIGINMNQFPSADDLASWAGVLSRQQRKRRQASQRQDRKRKPMAAAEAVPERLVCVPVQKELLCCLLSTNRCPPGTEAGDRSRQPCSAHSLLLPAAAQMSFSRLGRELLRPT